LDSTFFVLDSTFWLDSMLKIDPVLNPKSIGFDRQLSTTTVPCFKTHGSGVFVLRANTHTHTHTYCDKLRAASASRYYVVGVDKNDQLQLTNSN